MSVKNDSVDVLWTPSTDNGRPISLYVVQLANSFDENVWQTVFSGKKISELKVWRLSVWKTYVKMITSFFLFFSMLRDHHG